MTTKSPTAVDPHSVERPNRRSVPGRVSAFALACVIAGCEGSGASGGDAAGRADGPTASSASAEPSAPVGPSAIVEAAASASALGGLRFAPLARVTAESQGLLTGSLAGEPAVSVLLHLSTTEQPLADRSPIAYFRLAQLLAPGLVPDTVLRGFTLGELSAAAKDEATRRRLRRDARALADGKVRAAVVKAPPPTALRVDVADLTQGGRTWGWENQLVARRPVEHDAELLASYQALLAVDYIAGNLNRRHARIDPGSQRLVAVEDNEVFSAHGVEGAVGDGFQRFSRFMVYSAELAERLSALQRDALERSLSDGGENLVTPKQIEEMLSRGQSLRKIVDTRIERRGRARALALP